MQLLKVNHYRINVALLVSAERPVGNGPVTLHFASPEADSQQGGTAHARVALQGEEADRFWAQLSGSGWQTT